MLTQLRKYGFLKIFLWLVILSFLATIFVVWGVGDNEREYGYVAKVGNNIITMDDYANIEKQVEQYRMYYGAELDTEQLKRDLLNNRIDNILLLDEAQRLKIVVSDEEVVNIVTQTPKFYDRNGKFSIQVYEDVLKYSGYTPSMYEQSIRENLYLAKIKNLIRGSVYVTEQEIVNEYNYRNTALDISYFAVDTGSYVTAEPTEFDVELYYKDVKDLYTVPAQIKVKGLKIDRSDFKYVSTVTDEMVRSAYESSIAYFTVPENITLSHISVNIDDTQDLDGVARAWQVMESALEELNQGVPFATVAAKYSEGETASEGGYLGSFKKPDDETLSEEIYTIFSLNPGEFTDIIDTGSSLEIFQVEERSDEYVVPFDEVKDEIKSSLEEENYESSYRSYVYDVYREVLRLGNITAYNQEHPGVCKVYETPYLFENDADAFFQQNPELKKLLFSLNVTNITNLVDLNDGIYIFELTGKKSSYIPELEDIYSIVAADYKVQASYNLALKTLNEIVVQDSVTVEEFQDYADTLKVKIYKLGSLTRAEIVPKVEWAVNMEAQLFKTPESGVIIYPVPLSSYIYVARINKVTLPPVGDLKDEGGMLREELLTLKQNDAMQSYIDKLRAKSKVEINPAFQ